MAKITLSNVSTLTGINQNFQALANELNNKVLYRDNPGGQPNTIQTDTDYNGKSIYNANQVSTQRFILNGVELESNQVATADALKIVNNLSDVSNVVSARTNLGLGSAAQANIGTSGGLVPVLNGINTWSALQNYTGGAQVSGVPIVTTTSTQTLTNKTLTAPVIGTISNTGTLTLPTSTDVLVGRNTTDTLTNKTLTTPTVNGAALSGTFSGTPTYSGAVTFTNSVTPSQTAGIVGTNTNNNVNAGSIGEYITASSSLTSMSTSVTTSLVSVSLTAGDWDVEGLMYYTPAGSTVITGMSQGLNTSVAFGALGTATEANYSGTAGQKQAFLTPTVRFSLATTTTINLVTFVSFTVSTLQGQGFIRARRVR